MINATTKHAMQPRYRENRNPREITIALPTNNPTGRGGFGGGASSGAGGVR
jgi:hypothetical protein